MRHTPLTLAKRLAPALLMTLLVACSSSGPRYATPEGTPERLRQGYRLMTQGAKAQELGRDAEAIRKYREAVAIAPELSAAWTNLGVLYQKQQENIAASECYKRAADLSPSDPRPLANLGLLYQSVDWYEEALIHYGEALERDPSYLPALRGAVQTASVLERRDDRLLEWTERGLLIEKDPEWLEVFERQRISTEAVVRRNALDA